MALHATVSTPRWASRSTRSASGGPASKHVLRIQHLIFAAALIIFVGLTLSFARAPSTFPIRYATRDRSSLDNFPNTSSKDESSKTSDRDESSRTAINTTYYSSTWPENVNCSHTLNGTFTDAECLMKDGREAALLYHNSRPHLEVFSNMSQDGNYFFVDFGDWETFNVNILPDPKVEDEFIVIANLIGIPNYRYQLACQARFVDNVMKCTHSPLTLPVASTFSYKCEGPDFGYNWNAGPTDARAFYGGDTSPYLTYGTPGEQTCLSQYMHDLRRLYMWGDNRFVAPEAPWFYPTELQRPPPYYRLEKNYFVFWDRNLTTYVHTDLQPRVFARLYGNGSVSEDLAPAATTDAKCMTALMPKLLPTELEHMHQATNSLSVTLCKRSDPGCKATDDNTFLMVIIQVKTLYSNIPGFYSPFVMMFSQSPPFQIHGVSEHPIWYSGRGRPHEAWSEDDLPQPQSEMFYTTSISWKHQNLTYHGFLDDTILIGMGIMDKRSAVIDVLAGDLLSNMAYCDDIA